MTQNLNRNLGCNTFINLSPNLLTNHPHVCTAGPPAPIPDTELSVSGSESQLWSDGYNSSPKSSVNDEQVSDEDLPESMLNDE
jgi:hypothetical protein